MPMKKITRTIRCYDFKIMQQESRDLWKEVKFEPIARKIQSFPAEEGVNPTRYVGTNGERWIVDFRSIQRNEVIGVFWRTVVDGLPLEELGGQFSPIAVAPEGGISEPSVFGIFDNSYLVYQINRRGPEAGDLSTYLSLLFDRKFKTDIVPAKLRTFDRILPQIVAFTVLHVRPRFDRMGRIYDQAHKSSLVKILKTLHERSDKSPEVKLSGGRHTTTDDAFEREFAEFLKEHLSEPENVDDFDILSGSALLQSGDIKPIDIMDKYHIEKKVDLKQNMNRALDIADAIRKIQSVYIEKKPILHDRTVKLRG